MNQEIVSNPPIPNKAPIRERFLKAWEEFYSHKKIFWLITSLFFLIFLVTISGIIFKLSGKNQLGTPKISIPTPTPRKIHEEEPKEPLDLAKEELIKLNEQIRNLDIRQQRLTPPKPEFKIDF